MVILVPSPQQVIYRLWLLLLLLLLTQFKTQGRTRRSCQSLRILEILPGNVKMATSFFLYFLWSGRGSISSNSSYALSRPCGKYKFWCIQIEPLDFFVSFCFLFPLKKQLFYLSTSYQLTMYHPPTQAAILVDVKGRFRYLPSRAASLKTSSSALQAGNVFLLCFKVRHNKRF